MKPVVRIPLVRGTPFTAVRMNYILLFLVVLLVLAAPIKCIAEVRDWRYWPFSSNSPWNYPIGSKAMYNQVQGLESLKMGLNFNDRWTSAVYISKLTDQRGMLYYSKDTWQKINDGLPNYGNSLIIEQQLRTSASTELLMQANDYSTTQPGSSMPIWPAVLHRAGDDYYSNSFYTPQNAKPSPDTDSEISIFQSNGQVLDIYGAIVLSNGDIVCRIASYIDAKGEGTGWSNGRRASMFPSFAGLLRDGEISGGDIRHALVCHMSGLVLKEEAIWPAYAFDMNAGYSGNLPMGALLALPPSIDINNIGLTLKGQVLAKAIQDYGIYVGDQGGKEGITLLAELGASDIRWDGIWTDLEIIKNLLRWVANNSENNRGGGGEPRRALAPPIQDIVNLNSPSGIRVKY